MTRDRRTVAAKADNGAADRYRLRHGAAKLYVQGVPVDALARILGCPPSTIRDLLKEAGYDDA